MKWTVETLDKTVDRELAELPRRHYARFLHVAEILEEHGPRTVGMPHIRYLKNRLWEIRLQGKDGSWRVISIAASGRWLILLHVFQKTPPGAMEKALKRAGEIT